MVKEFFDAVLSYWAMLILVILVLLGFILHQNAEISAWRTTATTATKDFLEVTSSPLYSPEHMTPEEFRYQMQKAVGVVKYRGEAMNQLDTENSEFQQITADLMGRSPEDPDDKTEVARFMTPKDLRNLVTAKCHASVQSR